MLRGLSLGVSVLGIALLWIQQGTTFPRVLEEEVKERNGVDEKRILTPEETELANSARAHIARVVERNLLRLFGAMKVVEDRGSQGLPRQQAEEEEEEEAETTVTANPHTLPQVAALLGAIFSGNINLTNVVDRAFYLVPDTVRSQVSGLFKLLGGNGGGQSLGSSTSSPVPPSLQYIPHPLDTTTAESELEPELQNTTDEVMSSTTVRSIVSELDAPVYGSLFEIPGQPHSPPQRERKTTKKPYILPDLEPVLPVAEGIAYDQPISEEELQKAEAEIVEEAKIYEPLVREKEPRFFLGSLRQIFSSSESLNITNIIRVMPDLFKGARQAFVLLESLGQIVSGEREIGDDD